MVYIFKYKLGYKLVFFWIKDVEIFSKLKTSLFKTMKEKDWWFRFYNCFWSFICQNLL